MKNIFNNIFTIHLNNLEKILIIISSFLLVFCSSDSNITQQTAQTIFFREIFYSGILHPRLFSIFDYSFIFLSVTLLFKWGTSFSNGNYYHKAIFVASILNFLSLMINPNNNSAFNLFGIPLLSDIHYYTFLIFMYTMFFLKYNPIRVEILRLFIKWALIFILIRTFQLTFFWLIGKGNYILFGFPSILVEEDTLIVLAFVQAVFWGVFLYKKNKISLLVVIFLIAFELMSFRRSGVFLSIIVDLIIYGYYAYRRYSPIVIFHITVAASLIFMIFINLFQFLPYKYGFFISRYLGEWISIPGIYYSESFKNLHLEQAVWAFDTAIRELSIWGYGFGNTEGIVSLRYYNSGIHNAYIAVWMLFGVFTTLYFLYLAFISLKLTFQIIVKKSRYKFNFYNFVRGISGIYLIVFWINAWVLPTGNFTEVKMNIFRVILFSILIGIDELSFENIFK